MSKHNPLGEPERHESYGLVGFYRVSYGGVQGGATLFGSSVKHGHVIRMRVSRARLHRELNRDRYMADNSIVEVDLSPTQFAEAITAMNQGDGLPCTLRYVGGERMDEPPFKAKQEQFRTEFADDVREVAAKVDSLLAFAKSLQAKPSVNKSDRESLCQQLEMLKQHLASNMPFVLNSFHEQLDKSVLEAKGEVEAFVMHRIVEAGLASIAAGQEVAQLAIEADGEPRQDPLP